MGVCHTYYEEDTVNLAYQDADFDRFCEQLEGLKGTVPLIRPSEAWTSNLLKAIRNMPEVRGLEDREK